MDERISDKLQVKCFITRLGVKDFEFELDAGLALRTWGVGVWLYLDRFEENMCGVFIAGTKVSADESRSESMKKSENCCLVDPTSLFVISVLLNVGVD